jgi:hypothetical protein
LFPWGKMKTARGRLWALCATPLAVLCLEVMGTVVCLPWESRRIRLTCLPDQWAWPPLVASTVPGTWGSKPFAILGMSCMIPGAVLKRLSPHFLVSISSRVSCTSFFTQHFHSLPQVGVVLPLLPVFSVVLTFFA